MTSSYTNLEFPIVDLQESKFERVLDELYFVFSIFDEEFGPVLLYNDSPLEEEVIKNLNTKVFSVVMQGVDFGPDNFAKMRGIVQIPHSEYFTSAIDILVRKENEISHVTMFVPLVIFLIFPRRDLATYAKIANNLEELISRRFSKGFSRIPSLTSIEHFVILLNNRIKESRFI